MIQTGQNSTLPVRFDVRGDFVQHEGVIHDSCMRVESDTYGTAWPDPRDPGEAASWRNSKWDRVVSTEVNFNSGVRVFHDEQSDALLIKKDGQRLRTPMIDTSLLMPFNQRSGLAGPDKLTIFNGKMSEDVTTQGNIKLSYNDLQRKGQYEEYPRYQYELTADGHLTAVEWKVSPCGLPDGSEGEHCEKVRDLDAEELSDGTIRTYLGNGVAVDVEPFLTRGMVNGQPEPPAEPCGGVDGYIVIPFHIHGKGA